MQTEKVKTKDLGFMRNIDINDYDYDLPADRIAQYPADERDKSQLLIYKDSKTVKDTFRNIADYLPSGSLLVFNNPRVIRARILFQKESGANVEIFCLEPLSPKAVSYTHLRAHETVLDLVCRLLL